MKHIFHIHTYRCKHGSDESDEKLVKTALILGAETISFTDHCPFPGNPFGNRMDIEQLQEYIDSLKFLREKYRDKIKIKIGLEVEFFPSMMPFYEELHKKELFPLIIGQHFYQHSDGTYSFSDEKDFKKANEHLGCSKAMIEGIKTGLFSVAAHPDRVFRHCEKWTQEMTDISNEIIAAAAQNNVILEKNLSSYEKYVNNSPRNYWRTEFWALADAYNQSAKNPVQIIIGLDAHSSEEMIQRAKLELPKFLFIDQIFSTR